MSSIDITAFTGITQDSGTTWWSRSGMNGSGAAGPVHGGANWANPHVVGFPVVDAIPDGAVIMSVTRYCTVSASMSSHFAGLPSVNGHNGGAGVWTWGPLDCVDTLPGTQPTAKAELAAFAVGAADVSIGDDDSLMTVSADVSGFFLRVEYEIPIVITPNSGGILGGDRVTIDGAGFVDGMAVTFDGTTATEIALLDANALVCVTPAHAAGAVDVVVTWPDASVSTLVAGFTYSSITTVPSAYAGPAQLIVGPPPVTLTLVGTGTRGLNNGVLVLAWTFLSGPGPTPTISDPTANETDVVFDTYAPGSYVFEFRVTTGGDSPLTAAATTACVLLPTIAPRVKNGSRTIVFADDPTVTLTPAVVDDGWAGALAYAWTQVAGPDTATIGSPSTLSTLITVPEATGTYVFALSVSRAEDELIGVGRWRVTVDAADLVEILNDDDVSLTANGVAIEGQLNSGRISKSLGANGTCSFVMYGAHADVCNDIVLVRGGVRLFGGVCLSTTLTFKGVESGLRFWTHRCVGYAWHLGRRTITASYTNASLSDIVAAIYAVAAPSGITASAIAPGLPLVTIAFDNTPLDAALGQCADLLEDAHWFVDDFKNGHFAVVEETGDPWPITLTHPWFKDLQVTRSVGATVTRVRVVYTIVRTASLPVDSTMRVDSLDGYDPAGGDTVINGTAIRYTGTRQRLISSVFENMYVVVNPSVIEDAAGELQTHAVSYGYSLQTALGETPIMTRSSPFVVSDPYTAVSLDLVILQLLDPGSPSAEILASAPRVTAVNVYRTDHMGAVDVFICALDPHGASFVDRLALANLPGWSASPPFLTLAPTVNTADEIGYFLTGCEGTLTTRTPAVVVVDDVDAQAALAAKLGGDDDGVIEITLQGGDLSTAAARDLAQAYLDQSKDLSTSIGVTVHDDAARQPGQTLTVQFPEPIDVDEALTIQQADTSGFTHAIAHEYGVTAARRLRTLEDLLKRRTA